MVTTTCYTSPISLSHNMEPPDRNHKTNGNNVTNSLKRSPPQYHHQKYSKNKHLSQQIHKKKKNRNKQTMYKKKKLIKEKTSNKKHFKPKKAKLKRTKSRSSLGLNQNDDDFEDLYVKTENKMNKKHQKIQVLKNTAPYYYMDESVVTSNKLNNYNFTNNSTKKSKMLWIESPILKHVPSPMILPGSVYQSPFNSPLLGSCQLTANNVGGELLGFESTNKPNKLFRSLSDQTDSSQNQLSTASDYKYEGLLLSERVDHDISNCLNTLRAINNANDTYHAHQLSLNKLDEMQNIINALRDKIITDDDEKCANHKHQKLDDEHDDNDDDECLISGVRLTEAPTKNESDNVQYYDFISEQS